MVILSANDGKEEEKLNTLSADCTGYTSSANNIREQRKYFPCLYDSLVIYLRDFVII